MRAIVRKRQVDDCKNKVDKARESAWKSINVGVI